ncbi:MAG TPA: hypothetical protein VLA91_01345 [Acidimicrobiia bacterium]|nr:hypothetical protein [Acidimicrobiia bacterium]
MEITPRSLAEILAEGMTMLAKVWRRLFAPAFWSFLALGGLTIATFAFTGSDEFLELVLTNPEAIEAMTDAELLEPALRLLQTVLIAVTFQFLATGFVTLTTHLLVASEISGAPLSTGAAVARAFGRLLTLVIAAVLGFVAVVIGLFALIVPGLWLAGLLTMVTAVIALEEVGPVEALRRSISLVRPHWWRTVGFLLLVGLLGSIAAQLVQLVALPVLGAGGIGIGDGLGFVVLVIVQGMVVAAIAVMTTLWYVDLRARQGPLLRSSLP